MKTFEIRVGSASASSSNNPACFSYMITSPHAMDLSEKKEYICPAGMQGNKVIYIKPTTWGTIELCEVNVYSTCNYDFILHSILL